MSVIQKARDYLATPSNWTKGEMFRDARGISTTRDKAVCACLHGALSLAAGGRGTEAGRKAYDDAAEAVEAVLDGAPISVFNDDPKTTHADVLAVLDKALYHG